MYAPETTRDAHEQQACLVGKVDHRSILGLYVLQKGRLRFVDAALAEILGYDDPTQLMGKSLWEWVHPDDHGRMNFRMPPVPAQNVSEMASLRVYKRDGTTLRVCLRGDLTIFEGRPAHLGCLIDMRAYAEMKQDLEKYRAMINEVDDLVAEMDLKGNFIFSNSAACRKWNTLCDTNQAVNFRTYVDEASLESFIRQYKHVYTSGRPGKHIIYKAKLADGRRLTVEESVYPIRDDENTITGFRIVGRDISDRKAAEERLTRQRTQLEAIFRSVNDAIITVDPDFRIIETNLSVKTICGLDWQEMAGRRFAECPHRCSRACMKVLRQTIEHKRSFKEFSVACRHSRQVRQMVNISSSPLLDHHGHFIGAVLVIRDITQLQQMESELRQRHQYGNIVGKSPGMVEIFGLVKKLTDLDTTVLLTGENGTGKELIAKALHYSGRRAFKPFVAVNCAALNESLLESELFGHVKGAFTGAIRDKQGRFEAADGGTVLLDEIGDVSPLIQLKLLRVLEEKKFERVGEAVSKTADLRIIACTNTDLKEKIKNGEFREDLYYRLKVVQLHLPALRERREDIALLADHFRNHFNKRFHRNIRGFSRQVLRRFTDYAWPGNVRELEHVIERAFVLCRGSEIRIEHLPLEISPLAASHIQMHGAGEGSPQNGGVLLEALAQARWNKSRAAEMLGISRQTLYRKVKAYKMEFPHPGQRAKS